MTSKSFGLALALALTFSNNAFAELDVRESDGASDTQDMSENAAIQCAECLIPVIQEICEEEDLDCNALYEILLPPVSG